VPKNKSADGLARRKANTQVYAATLKYPKHAGVDDKAIIFP
jgi:hypothetical protein